MSIDISPEEILKMREEQSGIVYDDPIDDETSVPNGPVIEQEIKISNERKESESAEPVQHIPTKVETSVNLGNINDGKLKPEPITSFGKAQSYSDSPSFDIGWKNLPVELLPSKGLFYPNGTKIAIRAADVK